MREAPDGGPLVGPTARSLGVRPGVDIPVFGVKVIPRTGGLSVAPDDPSNLPAHRRPPEFDGTGKDPVWMIGLDSLGDDLVYRQDKPSHGLLEPVRETTLASYQATIADSAQRWLKC